MTAAPLTDEQRRAVENVLYGHLLHVSAPASGFISGASRYRFGAIVLAARLADARIVAELAGLDLTLPHFAPLVDVIEQAIALPDRKDGAA